MSYLVFVIQHLFIQANLPPMPVLSQAINQFSNIELSMLEVSPISIKTLKFGNTDLMVSQPQMGVGCQKMKIKNINNFVYMNMRTIHHSLKKQKNQSEHSKQAEKFSPFHHELNRPKSSIQNIQSRESRAIPTQIITNKKSKSMSKSLISPSLQIQQMKSECLKNYFPKRMPKKNKDIRWHKYYSFLNTIHQTLDLHFDSNGPKIYEETKEKRGNVFKVLKQRPKTGQSNMTRRRKSIELQSVLTSELSPWNSQHIPLKKK